MVNPLCYGGERGDLRVIVGMYRNPAFGKFLKRNMRRKFRRRKVRQPPAVKIHVQGLSGNSRKVVSLPWSGFMPS